MSNINNLHISLIGMMGSGKTTFGKYVAKKLDYNFIDSDSIIMSKTNMSIESIFSQYGESEFRNIENKILKEILAKNMTSNFILSTGGGCFINAENRKLLLDKTICVYLKSNITTLAKRLQKAKQVRPLIVNSTNIIETITPIIEKREPLYNQADIIIDNSNLSLSKGYQILLEEIENVQSMC